MSELTQIIYVSKTDQPWSDDDLDRLLFQSRQNNERLHITGMLLYDEQTFLQIIEGTANDIIGLYAKISQDSRHHDVVTIVEKSIRQRFFPDWSMGFQRISSDSGLQGFNDFFQQQQCLSDIEAGRALKILRAFEKGSWH